MTLLDYSSSASVATDGHVEARFGDRATRLHPQWLREQSTEPGQIEATNRQRLFTPLDVEPGLVAVDAELDGDTLTVALLLSGVQRRAIAAYLAARVLPSLLPELRVDEVGNLAALAASSQDCLSTVARSLRQARLAISPDLAPTSPRPTSPRSRP